MHDFKKKGGFGGNRGSGRRDFGNSGGFRSFSRPGNREFRKTQMFSATCAECHKPCEVPFKPNGEKPVYCNYCFGKNKGGAGGRPSEFQKKDFGRNFQRNDSVQTPVARPQFDNSAITELKKQIDAINSKIDKIMAVLMIGEVQKTAEPKETIEQEEKKVAKKKSAKSAGKKK